jgi:hypothetical protein
VTFGNGTKKSMFDKDGDRRVWYVKCCETEARHVGQMYENTDLPNHVGMSTGRASPVESHTSHISPLNELFSFLNDSFSDDLYTPTLDHTQLVSEHIDGALGDRQGTGSPCAGIRSQTCVLSSTPSLLCA